MLRLRIVRLPRLKQRPQRHVAKIRTSLQKAVKPKQNALVGLVEIAERTHPFHMFAHESSKVAGVGCRPSQALQRLRIIADESAHDRGKARPVELPELVKRIARFGAATVHPLQKAIEDTGTVTHDVNRP